MDFNIRKNIPALLSFIMLATTVILFKDKNNANVNIRESSTLVNSVDDFSGQGQEVKEISEIRAVWIPFMSLNIEDNFSQEVFENKFTELLENAKRHKINTLIVHIRPYGDALYPSGVFPWSHILTGIQGKEPNFNPLEYMIKKTHDSEMEFHAWINPFRVKVNGTPRELSEDNPAYKWMNSAGSQDSDIIMKCGDDLYYNPAYTQVRKLIIDGIRELVEGYDIDAVQFDDYFYPKDRLDIDKNSYNKYVSSFSGDGVPLDLQSWRMDNINTLVSGVFSTIKSIKPNVKFGISPAGNLNNVKAVSADVETWANNDGYVDYLCPQIYTNFDNPVLPFKQAADDWRSLVKNKSVNLYLGMSVYKAGSDVDEGTWKKYNNILKRQIEYCREIGYNGFMLYSIDYLESEDAKEEVENVVEILN